MPTGNFNSVTGQTEYEAQFLRTCSLIVGNTKSGALDLSQFRIKFAVKRSDTMTPNTADILVYNLAPETAAQIQADFKTKTVILEAGYVGNSGIIFKGNIKQVIIGRESATDTFVNIIAGDGDQAFNYSVINTTLAAGSTQADQVGAAVTAMTPKGVTAGQIGTFSPFQLPRGKVMFGNARDYLRDVAQTNRSSWSIQDQKLTFVKQKAYLPGERVVLTSKTGMIGTPEQTTEGVNTKSLLNPRLKISGRVEINEASVARLKINLSVANSPANIPAPVAADGVYYLLVVEHTGDTRGVPWYSSLICLNVSVTSNPINSVQVGRGGEVRG